MTYAKNAQFPALVVGLNPSLATGLLATLANAEAAMSALDGVTGVSDGLQTNLMTAPPSAVVGVWAPVVVPTELYCGHYANTASNADLDRVDIPFRCRQDGRYRLEFNMLMNANAPICFVYIDGVQVGLAIGYDGYAAAPNVLNIVAIDGLALGVGLHTLRLECNGRNIAAGDNILCLSGVSIRRVA
jgi:hypothetical protein